MSRPPAPSQKAVEKDETPTMAQAISMFWQCAQSAVNSSQCPHLLGTVGFLVHLHASILWWTGPTRPLSPEAGEKLPLTVRPGAGIGSSSLGLAAVTVLGVARVLCGHAELDPG